MGIVASVPSGSGLPRRRARRLNDAPNASAAVEPGQGAPRAARRLAGCGPGLPASLPEEPPAPEDRGVGQAELAQGDLGHHADRVARRVGDDEALDVLPLTGPFGDEAVLEEVEEGPPEGRADQ